MTQMEQLPLAAVVIHPVEDFARWKPAFDAHQGAREQAGIYAHCLNRLSPDDQVVCAYFLAKNRDQLEAFLAAPGLADAMKEAGVSGPPSISLVRQVEDSSVWDRPLAAAIVIHEVTDFGRWKKAFDDHAPERQRAGLTAHAVNRSEENPNQVVVFLQAEDEQTLRAFLDAPELEQAMQAAGVVGAPEVTFLRSLERVDY
jgi:quinol monooxygenase YgiN